MKTTTNEVVFIDDVLRCLVARDQRLIVRDEVIDLLLDARNRTVNELARLSN